MKSLPGFENSDGLVLRVIPFDMELGLMPFEGEGGVGFGCSVCEDL